MILIYMYLFSLSISNLDEDYHMTYDIKESFYLYILSSKVGLSPTFVVSSLKNKHCKHADWKGEKIDTFPKNLDFQWSKCYEKVNLLQYIA